MKRYKIAAWLMIIHGGFMEIGGVLCALPALILGSGKFDIGQYFSFKLQYFQDNLYMILFMGAIFGVMRIIGAIGLLKNRMWGLALSVCLGGNASLVGAAANLVTVGIAEKNGYMVSFSQFLVYGVPVTLGSMVLASIYIIVRYYLYCQG